MGGGTQETDESVGMQVSSGHKGFAGTPLPQSCWANSASGSGPAGGGPLGIQNNVGRAGASLAVVVTEDLFFCGCLFHSREIRVTCRVKFILFSAADLSQLTLAELWGLGTY